jgi:hypothetical protein
LPSKLSVQAHIQQILHFPPAIGQRMAEDDFPFAPRPSLSGDWRIEYPVTPQPGHPIKISIICGDLAQSQPLHDRHMQGIPGQQSKSD